MKNKFGLSHPPAIHVSFHLLSNFLLSDCNFGQYVSDKAEDIWLFWGVLGIMSSFYVFILGGDSNNQVVDLNSITGLDNLNKKRF